MSMPTGLNQIRTQLPETPAPAEETYVPNVAWELASALGSVRAAIHDTNDPAALVHLFNTLHPLMHECATLTHSCIAKAIQQLPRSRR